MLEDALIVVGGYLIGSIPFGVVLVKVFRGEDIRRQGSGNIGASNVWRTYGRGLGVPVALLDVAKGFAPALVGVLLGGELVGVLAGAAAMLGHARPVWLGFRKGGKMVATGGGVLFGLAPKAAAIGAGLWLLVALVTRYASVASLTVAVLMPVLEVLTGRPWEVVAFTIVLAVAIFVLHRENIRRLMNGTEHRLSFRRGSASSRAGPSSGPAA